jgi:predicted 3-demethylubiquinone-9 3-methyltransferase (glyoxalase superfamily)
MQKITTFLSYNDQAAQAVELYTSLFPGSRVLDTLKVDGKVLTIEFELAGQRYVAMNGGPPFTFAMGISLQVNCESQAEIDRLWDGLLANGGKPNACGWLTDRFGVSWQITPTILPKLLMDKDAARADRAMKAMMNMIKLDIAEIERAANG